MDTPLSLIPLCIFTAQKLPYIELGVLAQRETLENVAIKIHYSFWQQRASIESPYLHELSLDTP